MKGDLEHKIILACEGREEDGPHLYRVHVDNWKSFQSECSCSYCKRGVLERKELERWSAEQERLFLFGYEDSDTCKSA